MNAKTRPVGAHSTATLRRRAAVLVVLLVTMAIGIVAWSVSAQAATIYPVTATVAVGDNPFGVAVDPGTHAAYVANADGNSVSVIDGATDTVTHTIGVGAFPFGLAVDPTRHAAYVANLGDSTVSVIDEVRNMVTHTVGVGSDPENIAVDPATHTAWVANSNEATVSEINEVTNTVSHTIPMIDFGVGVAVDPGTHTVYVTNPDTDDVSVIDEASHTVTHTIHVGNHPVNIPGADPTAVAVDPSTHMAYVADEADNAVSVIDEDSNTVTHVITVGNNPLAVSVDPGTHTAYVANATDNTVSVIDEASNTVIADVASGTDPAALAVDTGTHAVYVTNLDDNTVSVISPTASQLRYQSITFTSDPPAQPTVGGSYVVTATGGGSGNPVKFTLGARTPLGTCAISDHGNSTATVSFTGSGLCVIDADQAGNARYIAAPQVRQTLTVAPGPVATLTPLDGFGQSTVVGTAFEETLLASVVDKDSNPTPGASVTFAVTAGSAHFPTGSTATVVADSDGDARSPILTAGDTAGPVTVTATSGVASGTFSETVVPATVVAADLAVTLSAPAEVRTGTKLALVVTVSNAGPSLAGRPKTLVPIPAGFVITKTGGGRKYGSTVVFGLWPGLAAGAGHRYTINLTTTRKMASDATFHASISSPTADPNPANNATSDTIHIN